MTYALPREFTVLLILGTCGLILYLLHAPAPSNVTSKKNADSKRVLVTGAAGFIGHHVSKSLAADPSNKVVGLDNFNDYYDVKLKMDRGYQLSKIGVEMYHEDLCTRSLLEDLFEKHNFTHVIHLAAQAGVRYSLKNPMAYVHSNVECQTMLLDILRDHPNTKLVYASSSSVYGKESAIPFRLWASTDKPGNMYAATKKTDELLALHYCMRYNLSTVGLRFFTVYGPYGRPDMAVYKFAEAIANGKELPLFQQSESEPLERDFTYVDDIVDGILSALDHVPSECGERFNLGFGNPLSVPNLISFLERELDTKAKVKILPIPPTEILRTWADIEVSSQVLNFKPEIDLEEGVKRFVRWYRKYKKQRTEEESTGTITQTQIWYNSLLNEKYVRNERYAKEESLKSNERHQRTVEHEREKYLEFVQTLRSNDTNGGGFNFLFFQGFDSIGRNILNVSGLKDDVESLKRLCWELEECIGFSSRGELKSSMQLQSEWKKSPEFVGNKEGLYVADKDPCKIDKSRCDHRSKCVSKSPGHYECQCRTEYSKFGEDCLPRYGALSQEYLESEFITNYRNIFNVTEIKQDRELIFIQEYDISGGNYMLMDAADGDIAKLQNACKRDPICLGINTQGQMKNKVGPRYTWKKIDNSNNEGIYLFDIDYCLFDTGMCPEDAECVLTIPAGYDCICKPGKILRSNICIDAYS